ncbi:hypothetical protein HDU76_002118, partial [Blyttiomyces sp. JEL0837]
GVVKRKSVMAALAFPTSINILPLEILENTIKHIEPPSPSLLTTIPAVSRRFRAVVNNIPKCIMVRLWVRSSDTNSNQSESANLQDGGDITQEDGGMMTGVKVENLAISVKWISAIKPDLDEDGDQGEKNQVTQAEGSEMVKRQESQSRNVDDGSSTDEGKKVEKQERNRLVKSKSKAKPKERTFLHVADCAVYVNQDNVPEDIKAFMLSIQQTVVRCVSKNLISLVNVSVLYGDINLGDSILKLSSADLTRIFRLSKALQSSSLSTPWHPQLSNHLATSVSISHLTLYGTEGFQSFRDLGSTSHSNISSLMLFPKGFKKRNGFSSMQGFDYFANLTSLYIFKWAVKNLDVSLQMCELPKGLKDLFIRPYVNMDTFSHIIQSCPSLYVFEKLDITDPDFCNQLLRQSIQLTKLWGMNLVYHRIHMQDLTTLAEDFNLVFPTVYILDLDFDFLEDGDLYVNSHADLDRCLPPDDFMAVVKKFDLCCPELHSLSFKLSTLGRDANVIFHGKDENEDQEIFEKLFIQPVKELCKGLRLKVKFI